MIQECLNCIELRKRIEELELKIFSLEKSRGEDIISIDSEDVYWHIVAHRDVDGVIQVLNYYIPHANVLFVMKSLLQIHDSFGKTIFSGRGKELAFVKQLLVKYFKLVNVRGDLINNKEFFGSRSIYMDAYYYPMKVLDYFGFIEYTNSGKVTLKNKIFEGGFNG